MGQNRPMFVLGSHEKNTLAQLADVASRAERVALMADGHLGYIMPVGGVAAYRRQVSVAGVGFDIACGNCAIRTDLAASALPRARLENLADRIQREISFGIGRTNVADDAPDDDPLFDDAAWAAVPSGLQERERLRQLARDQLGTVGSGNHYVDVFADELDRVWVGVHFGSRGFGHTIAAGFMAIASGRKWGERVPEIEALLDLASDEGERYWKLMQLAGRYAYAGREWVCRKVATGIVGGEVAELVHNHHNFAWRERHFGEELVVVRKGATPAFPGQLGFVGASMTGTSVILRGAAEPTGATDAQRAAMFSTVHGAGRVMSRTEAGRQAPSFRSAGGGAGSRRRRQASAAGKGLGRHAALGGRGVGRGAPGWRTGREPVRLPPARDCPCRAARHRDPASPASAGVVMAGADEHDPYKD